MSLTTQDVEKVALLAGLNVSAEEIRQFADQLGQIVAYVDQLSELNTDDVEPMAHASELSDVFRADQTAPSLDREDALANATHHNEEYFLVPPVLE